jgi:hypothetical protein
MALGLFNDGLLPVHSHDLVHVHFYGFLVVVWLEWVCFFANKTDPAFWVGPFVVVDNRRVSFELGLWPFCLLLSARLVTWILVEEALSSCLFEGNYVLHVSVSLKRGAQVDRSI